ncbi:MAG: divalent cation tolerance protein CutA [Crocinitomicaceae bacterium]|nr:divalent cation tolerance protein CutA [Crocinitomicaceae bacterium]
MILLRISSSERSKIEEIAALLLEKHLIIDVNVKQNIERWNLVMNKIQKSSIYLLTGKTRANLFSKIDEMLKEKYGENMPELYSLPIVNMDWQQADELQKFIPPNS